MTCTTRLAEQADQGALKIRLDELHVSLQVLIINNIQDEAEELYKVEHEEADDSGAFNFIFSEFLIGLIL